MKTVKTEVKDYIIKLEKGCLKKTAYLKYIFIFKELTFKTASFKKKL